MQKLLDAKSAKIKDMTNFKTLSIGGVFLLQQTILKASMKEKEIKMHYKVKKISLNKTENKLMLYAADSTVRPITYYEMEYDEKNPSLEKKLENFFISCMEGNLKLNASCKKWKYIADTASAYLSFASKGIKFHEVGYEYEKELEELIAKDFCIKMIQKKSFNEEELVDKLKEKACVIKNIAREVEKALIASGKIRIDSVNISAIYPGYNVFAKKGETILAPAENYANGSGILDVSEGNVIFFGENSIGLYPFLTGSFVNKERSEEYKELFDKVDIFIKEKASHLSMAKLPYKDFPYENLGINFAGAKVYTNFTTATTNPTEAMLKLVACLDSGYNAWIEVRENGDQEYPLKKKNPELDNPFNWTAIYGCLRTKETEKERFFNDTEKDLTLHWVDALGTKEAVEAYQKDGTIEKGLMLGGSYHCPVRIDDANYYRKEILGDGYDGYGLWVYKWAPKNDIPYYVVDDTVGKVFTICYNKEPVNKIEAMQRVGQFMLDYAAVLEDVTVRD